MRMWTLITATGCEVTGDPNLGAHVGTALWGSSQWHSDPENYGAAAPWAPPDFPGTRSAARQLCCLKEIHAQRLDITLGPDACVYSKENGGNTPSQQRLALGGGILGGAFPSSLCFLIFSKLSTVSVDYFHEQKIMSQSFLKSTSMSPPGSLSPAPGANTHLQGLCELLHDLVLDRGVTQDVIGGHAPLAAVHEFPPGDASVKTPG